MEPSRLKLNVEQLNALLDRIDQHKMTETDYLLIADLIHSMAWLSQKLEDQKITIHRLKKIFGFKTERTSKLPDVNPDEKHSEIKPDPEKDQETKPDSDNNNGEDAEIEDTEEEDAEGDSSGNPPDKPKRKGKKFSAKDYKNAIITKITHKLLQPGCRCPACQNGNLCIVDPGVILRIIGQPWLKAHIVLGLFLRDLHVCEKTII